MVQLEFKINIPSDVLLPASSDDCFESDPESCGVGTAIVPAALASLSWCCNEKSML